MQFRTNSQWSSITLLFIRILLSSLFLTLPLAGLYLYPYWTGKLKSKIVFFYFLKKRQIKAVFLPGCKFCVTFWNRNLPVLVSLRESFFPQRYIKGISDRTLEVGPRNESFPRNICSRALSYFPSRLDGRACKAVYEMRKTCSQDLFTHVSVRQLLVQTRINEENRGMRLRIPSFFL